MFFLLYTVSKSECKKCGKDSWILRDSVEFGNSVEEVVRELRFKIEQKTGLTASAGTYKRVSGAFKLVSFDYLTVLAAYYRDRCERNVS